MPVPISLLQTVGVAVLKKGVNLLAGGLPLGDVLVDVAGDVFRDWLRQRTPKTQAVELEALASASPAEVRREVQQLVANIAPGLPEAERQALVAYLQQVPASVRQAMRRPTDPTGTTIPAGLALRKAEDLLAFLPTRLPRFHAGDRPPDRGDWELTELLGMGGFGEVWKARNAHSEQIAAFKFCNDAEAARSLLNEARMLASVRQSIGQHPGIVHLLDTSLSSDPPFLVYEYVEGGDLAGLIQEWHRARGGPAPEQAARLVLRLADTVGFAHRLNPPIVHRDLKPANVLVQEEGSGYRLKVADFGIGGIAARKELALTAHGATTRGAMLANTVRGSYTPLYASPQQARREPPDPRDDVHALGVVWYQLLTGDLESGAPTGLAWADDLRKKGMSEGLVRLLGACVATKAEGRPADAAALAQQLTALLKAPALDAVPGVGPTKRPAQPPARHESLPIPVEPIRSEGRPLTLGLVLGGLALLVTVGLAGAAYVLLRSQPDPVKAPALSTPTTSGSKATATKYGPKQSLVRVCGAVKQDGQPLDGVVVRFHRTDNLNGPPSATAVTKAGQYELHCEPGRYAVTLSGSEDVPPEFGEACRTSLEYNVPHERWATHDINISK